MNVVGFRDSCRQRAFIPIIPYPPPPPNQASLHPWGTFLSKTLELGSTCTNIHTNVYNKLPIGFQLWLQMKQCWQCDMNTAHPPTSHATHEWVPWRRTCQSERQCVSSCQGCPVHAAAGKGYLAWPWSDQSWWPGSPTLKQTNDKSQLY